MVYYGGVEHEIRKEVWPFLLGHYKFGMDKKNMAQVKIRHTHVIKLFKCEFNNHSSESPTTFLGSFIEAFVYLVF